MFTAKIKDSLSIEVPESLERIYTNFETYTTEVVSRQLNEGDVFLDIGANFGYFSVLAASLVGPTGTVYAVEASPSVVPLLAENTRSFANVSIIQSAAGNRTGETEFHMTEDFVNSGVALSPFIRDSKKVSIPIDTLDNLLAREPGFIGRIDLVKCDVQGDEVAVLEGLRDTIQRNPRMRLIAEWAPAWMDNAGYDAQAFPEFLRSLGFREIVVIDDYLKTQMSLAEMEDEFRRDQSGKRFCNLFASK